jgi:hypothetical protein
VRRQHALTDSHNALGALATSMGHAGVPRPALVLGALLTVLGVGVVAQFTAISAVRPHLGRHSAAPTT